jgi:hypothetical protein
MDRRTKGYFLAWIVGWLLGMAFIALRGLVFCGNPWPQILTDLIGLTIGASLAYPVSMCLIAILDCMRGR